jgi:hypothetical protein
MVANLKVIGTEFYTAVKKKKKARHSDTHNYHPSYLGGRDRRIMIQGQPTQKLARPYLKNKPGMVVHSYNPSYLGGGGR